MEFFLKIDPPETTAQMKRLDTRGKRPRFYDSPTMLAAKWTYAVALKPHRPTTPLIGPLELTIRTVWAHPKRTRKGDCAKLWPKMTPPDCDNHAKQLQDSMKTEGFFIDDAQISRLLVERWLGPPDKVGIYARLRSFAVDFQP